MNKSIENKLLSHVKALDEIAVKEEMPFVLAMKTNSKGKSLRAANGDITSIVRLLAIMLVQLHQQTEEPLEELMNYFEMQVICAKECSEAYKPHAPEEGE